MKLFGKSLLFFSCFGFSCLLIEAQPVSILLNQTTKENYHLTATPEINQSCQKLTIENQGNEAVFNCLPANNDQKFLSLRNLAQLVAKEKNPLLALLQVWQKVVPLQQTDIPQWPGLTPLDYLNFVGSCPANEYQKQFLQLCHHLGIDTRRASLTAKEAYDYTFGGDEWSFLDLISGQLFLGWDNSTPVSSETLVFDPLLVLRAKATTINEEFDFAKAWQQFAHFQVIDPAFCNEEVEILPEINESVQGFDLYPQEKLVYSLIENESEEKPYRTSIEQTLNWSMRQAKNDETYHSPFPIQRILNATSAPLYLIEQDLILQPNESYSFLDQKIFKLLLQSKVNSVGLVKVTSCCAAALFPGLTKGENKVDLAVTENNSQIAFTFDMQEVKNAVQSSIEVLNSSHEFNKSLQFQLSSSTLKPIEKIWWQISADKHFKTVSSNFEQIQPYTPELTLPTISETYLNADDHYYFRVKGYQDGQWSEWSDTFAFIVHKPDSVNLVEFDQLDKNNYLLDWTRVAQATDSPIEYLVFASNAYDFIPSIYTTLQVNEIIDEKVMMDKQVNNLVAITSETKLVIDGSLAYYRIIARQNGQLSIPSPLIHIYGNDLIQPRTVLQMVEMDQTHLLAKRILFPATYPWTETALPRLGVNSRLYENSLLALQNAIECATDLSISKPSNSSEPILAPYVRPAHVSRELWEKMRPYFLPENHPWRLKIDRIFTKARVSQNPDTIRKAGFKGRVTNVRHIFAGTHPECVECFFKIYLDSEVNMHYTEWQKWIDRIVGKNRVKECIKKHGFEKWFSVPDKWVYPLPEKPYAPRSTRYNPKNFILCCSNERPYEHIENERLWKKQINKNILDMLYILIDEPGMWDSVFPFNIPFCKQEGKMCFVDTEYSNKWPIRFEKLNRYLSSENVKYWEYLIKHNGPKGYKSPHPAH